MTELDSLKRVVNESGELSKRGQNKEALRLLDGAIAEAVRESRRTWVSVLCRHASVIADEMGDLPLVRKYRERCLELDPENPLTLCSLAEVLHRLGVDDLAKKYAAKSYQLSMNRDTELDRAVIESLRQTWPDLEGWQS
jgi:tetratricopeptide (TPR) repeat protein